MKHLTEEIADLRHAKEEKQQLRMAYARLFASVDGLAVLADLQAQFGWRDGVERSTYQFGIAPNDFIHRDGAKEPIRHILRQIGPINGEPKQNKEAVS